MLLFKFSSNFNEILLSYCKDIIKTHDFILQFCVKKWLMKKNSFISQNHWPFTETRKMGTENNLWKFELDPIIFLDFKDIWSLKYKEIRVSGAKHFWGVYIAIYI